MPGILSQAVISQDKIPGISERNMKLFKYLHIFYLLVLSEEREELLPEELRRLSELRTLEAFLFSLLTVFTLLRLGLFLSLFLILVVYTLSLPAGRLLELGRIFTEPKSERRVVWYDLLFRILHEPV